MLKISMLPVMTRMVARLDLKPAIARLKGIDIFDAEQKKLTPEQLGVLTAEILAELLPQIDKIGADIPEFVALYKGISIENANELDIAEVFAELRQDEGITGFFKRALRQKVAPEP